MAGEILPTVGISDIAGTRAGKAAIAGKMKRVAILPGQQITVCACIVVPAAAVEMRREQSVERHILASEPERDDNGVPKRVRRYLQFQAISFTLVHDAGERDIGLGERELVSRDTFDLMPFGPAGDDETEVADLRAAG